MSDEYDEHDESCRARAAARRRQRRRPRAGAPRRRRRRRRAAAGGREDEPVAEQAPEPVIRSPSRPRSRASPSLAEMPPPGAEAEPAGRAPRIRSRPGRRPRATSWSRSRPPRRHGRARGGRDRRPRRLHRARGDAERTPPLRRASSSRATTASSRTGCSPARSRRSRRPASPPTRSRSCRCRARSSFRSPRWRSRRRAATPASSRSARSCAARRRTSTTSPPRQPPGCSSPAIETGVPVAFGVLTVETVEQAEARIDRAGDAVRTALEMADVFAQLRAAQCPRLSRPLRLHWLGRCRRSAQSAGRSPASGTTAPTRWWPRTAASIRTSSGSGCSSTASPAARTSAPAASRAAR